MPLSSSQGRFAVRRFLNPPPVPRIEVAVDGAPFKGPATAPVTIVEFTDFHCPFCKRVLPTLTQLLSQYGDKVKEYLKVGPEGYHRVTTKQRVKPPLDRDNPPV